MRQGDPAGQRTAAQNSSLQCNCFYFKSLSAVFKIAQVISCLLAFICLQGYWIIGCGSCLAWFQAATMTGLLASLMFLFIYPLNIAGKCYAIPWRSIDFSYCVLWLIFTVASATKLALVLSVCDSCSDLRSGAIGAIFFGFVAAIAYGVDAGLQLCNCIRGVRA